MDLLQNLAKLKKEFPEVSGESQNIQLFFNFPNDKGLAIKFVENNFPFIKLKNLDKKHHIFVSQPLFPHEANLLTPYLKVIHEKYHPDTATPISAVRNFDVKFNEVGKTIEAHSFIIGKFEINSQSDVGFCVEQIKEFSYVHLMEQHQKFKNTYLAPNFISNLQSNLAVRLTEILNDDFIVPFDNPHTLEGFTPTGNVINDIASIAINIGNKVYKSFNFPNLVYHLPYQPLHFSNRYLDQCKNYREFNTIFHKAFCTYIFQHYNISAQSFNKKHLELMAAMDKFRIIDDTEDLNPKETIKTQEFWNKYHLPEIKKIHGFNGFNYDEEELDLQNNFTPITDNEIANILNLHFTYKNMEAAFQLAVKENLTLLAEEVVKKDWTSNIKNVIKELNLPENSPEAKEFTHLVKVLEIDFDDYDIPFIDEILLPISPDDDIEPDHY